MRSTRRYQMAFRDHKSAAQTQSLEHTP
ncbi:rCG54501 [Rattus norvegicus]|uniref:RCG54501 n=1 Tax=Rattus norvegicus TaxID=10116 RepID=A6JA93_RAT|nr:rCG54501 [Rattus norvegicus]